MTLATSDPTNGEAIHGSRSTRAMSIQASLAPAVAIERAIRRHYYGEQTVAVTPPRLARSVSPSRS